MPRDHVLSVAGALSRALRSKSQGRRAALSRDAASETYTTPSRNDLCPKLEIVEREIGALRFPKRNVRQLDAMHIREVANSIAMLGFCAPILIDQDDGVIDGLVRLKAAERVGLRRVPCVIVGHLTAAERRVLRLALNRLQEKGGWDLNELRIEVDELILVQAPVEITGFTSIEIDQLRLDDEPSPIEDGSLEPDSEAKATAQLGDVFQLGSHRIACGDARDERLLASLTGEDLARLCLTDVPYNVPIQGHVTDSAHREFAMASGEMTPEVFGAFNKIWIDAVVARLMPGGVFGTFIDWRGFPTVDRAALSCALSPLNLIVWSKTNAGMGSLYRSAHELLPLYKKGSDPHVNNVQLGKHGRWRSNVWVYPGASSVGSDARQGLRSHPTVKPTAMLEDAILDLTNPGEIVLDPFLGSGSTLIAAEKCGRQCRGVEIDPLYVDLIVERYRDLTGKDAILEETGEVFSVLRERRTMETASHE